MDETAAVIIRGRPFSFSRDGTRVIVGGESASVWDVSSGQSLTPTFYHDEFNDWRMGLARGLPVPAVDFSIDGLRVATAGADGTARVWDARSGEPLSEWLRHHDSAERSRMIAVQFSADARQLLTVSTASARVWELPIPNTPVPDWLVSLAEAVVGKRFNDRGVAENVPFEKFFELKRKLTGSSETNYCSRWARWFLAERPTRTISPDSPIRVPEYVSHRIAEDTLASVSEAVSLSPTNGLALARLARKVLAQAEDINPRRTDEADFYSRRAVQFAPNDPQVLEIRSEIAEQINKLQNP
jgi:hypothetical protein